MGDRIAHADNLSHAGRYLFALPVYLEAWNLDEDSTENQLVHSARFAATLAHCPVLLSLDRFRETEILSIGEGGGDSYFVVQHTRNIFKCRPGHSHTPVWPKDDPTLQDAAFAKNGGLAVSFHTTQVRSNSLVKITDLSHCAQLASITCSPPVTAVHIAQEKQLLFTGHENG